MTNKHKGGSIYSHQVGGGRPKGDLKYSVSMPSSDALQKQLLIEQLLAKNPNLIMYEQPPRNSQNNKPRHRQQLYSDQDALSSHAGNRVH